ncbi:MAG: hypothetical protein ACFFD4_39830, partial [Candidatus Odinarchaeota archaeon]
PGADTSGMALVRHNVSYKSSFDLKYRGSGKLGMRQWLKDVKKWSPGDIDALMGASPKQNQGLREQDRSSTCLFFGIPYKLPSTSDYLLKIFGFAPVTILSPNELINLCNEYMVHIFDRIFTPRVTKGESIIISTVE